MHLKMQNAEEYQKKRVTGPVIIRDTSFPHKTPPKTKIWENPIKIHVFPWVKWNKKGLTKTRAEVQSMQGNGAFILVLLATASLMLIGSGAPYFSLTGERQKPWQKCSFCLSPIRGKAWGCWGLAANQWWKWGYKQAHSVFFHGFPWVMDLGIPGDYT